MKKWYQSKTLWVNFIGCIAILLQEITGHEVLTPDAQVTILALANMILRFFTKTEIEV